MSAKRCDLCLLYCMLINAHYIRFISIQTEAEVPFSQESTVVLAERLLHNFLHSVYLNFYEQGFLPTFMTLTRKLVGYMRLMSWSSDSVSESIETQKHNKASVLHMFCSTLAALIPYCLSLHAWCLSKDF